MAQRVFTYEKFSGVAGQIGVTVTETGGYNSKVTFVGSAYGGPVVMILGSGIQTFVTNPERFGKFAEDRVAWAAAFAAEVEAGE